MPIMPRANKKAQTIAFKILGKPSNMKKESYKKVKIAPDVNTNNARYEELMRLNYYR